MGDSGRPTYQQMIEYYTRKISELERMELTQTGNKTALRFIAANQKTARVALLCFRILIENGQRELWQEISPEYHVPHDFY